MPHFLPPSFYPLTSKPGWFWGWGSSKTWVLHVHIILATETYELLCNIIPNISICVFMLVSGRGSSVCYILCNSPYKKISQDAQNVFDKHCPEKPGPIISVTGYIDKWLAVTRLRFYVVPQISWLPWTGSKIPLFGRSYTTAFSFIRHPGATTTASGSKPAQHGQTLSGKYAKTPRVQKYETILRDSLFSAPNSMRLIVSPMSQKWQTTN